MSGKLNINKALDFATLTNSIASDAALQALQIDRQYWLLTEGSYKGGGKDGQRVVFHVMTSVLDYNGAVARVVDKGGRRKAKIGFPYVDGQTTDDLGRKAENFEVDIEP